MSVTTAADGPTVGLRKRKKAVTYAMLQAAARRLVAERGMAQVTIEDIAAAANVSYRTFFNYFDSKEAAVFDSAEPDAAEVLAAELAARPADEPPLVALHAAVVRFLGRQASGLRELAALVRADPDLANRESAAFVAFQDVIISWASRRLGVDPQVSAYPALLAGITQVVTRLVVTYCDPDRGEEQIPALADDVFTLLARGLPAEPALRVEPDRRGAERRRC